VIGWHCVIGARCFCERRIWWTWIQNVETWKVWSVFNIICAYSLNSFQVLLNVPIIHFNYYNYFKILISMLIQPKCKDILFVLWTTCFACFLLVKGSSSQSKKEAAKCQQSTSKLLLCSNIKAKLEWSYCRKCCLILELCNWIWKFHPIEHV